MLHCYVHKIWILLFIPYIESYYIQRPPIVILAIIILKPEHNQGINNCIVFNVKK